MEQTNYQYELSFHEVFKKDSLEITEEDREKLKNYITRLSEKTIIITHGSFFVNSSGVDFFILQTFLVLLCFCIGIPF
jgi:hypothetical protein